MTSTIDTAARRRVTPTGILVLPSSAPKSEWLQARKDGITATDIVKIVGLSNFGTALTVAAEKRATIDEDTELSEAGHWGQELEDYVARRWAETRVVSVRRVGLMQNVHHPWMLASLDRLVTGCPDGRCGAEIKTTGQWLADSWDGGVPPRVNAQVQWQLAVSGLDHMHAVVLIGGQRLVEHVVQPDAAYIGDLMAAGALAWEAIEAGVTPTIPPHLMTVDILNDLYPDRSGERVVDGDKVRQMLTEYRELTEGAAAFEEAKDRIKVELLMLLGDGEAAVDELGLPLFTYKAQSSRRTDLKRLEAEHPDVYADVVSSSVSRVFRPAKGVTA